jgi:hypothetical protein
MNVIAFPSKLALGARKNLADLVARARALKVFGPTVDFDAPTWDISHLLDPEPGRASTNAVLYFTARQVKPSKTMEGRTVLAATFGDFLKSIIAMKQLARTPSFSTHQRTVIVARFLYEVLAHCGHDIVEARSTDFYAAASLIKKTSKGGGAYNNAYELERIGSFVNKYQLSKSEIRFSNPIERVDSDDFRVDEESRKARAEKLPSPEYIAAVVEASLAVRSRDSDPDLARICVLEQLACAPWRINGLLGLRAGCERRENSPDGKVKFGIAHGGSKGAPDEIKPVPTKMAPIAERSLADLHRLTQPSREVAKWIEDHPGRAWLPEPWRLGDRNTPMTARDIANALGFTKNDAAQLWMKTRGLASERRRGRLWYTQGQVEDAILAELPDVPRGRRLSEYLMLFPRNYFHAGLSPILAIPTLLSQGQMRVFLVGTEQSKSIFVRLEIRDSERNAFDVPSHGLRHYLNNLANEGLLSDLDIARWSGRKDVSQNAAYDHTGGAPLGRVVQEAVKTKEFNGAIVATVRKLRPAARDTFLKARFATAHTTDIGMCVSDWSLTPCASHGACAAGCGDHVLVKGKPEHLRRTQTLLAEHEAMLDQVKQGAAQGELGAGPWVEHNEKMVTGLRKAIAVHQDSAIPDGTIVQV